MCGRRMSRSVRSTTPSSRIGLRHFQHLPNWSYLYRRGMSHRMLAREVHRLLHALALEEFERAHLLLGSGERSTNHFLRSVPDPTGPCFARRMQCLAENVRSDELTSDIQSLMRNSYDVFC